MTKTLYENLLDNGFHVEGQGSTLVVAYHDASLYWVKESGADYEITGEGSRQKIEVPCAYDPYWRKDR